MNLIPIIDAGHGGFIDGEYTTAPKKMFEFEDDGLVVHEGLINRLIASKLIDLLDSNDIPYHQINVYDQADMPLRNRVETANNLYSENKLVYYLSIHSNTASALGKGPGTTASGFEIWTSVGQTKSDELADVAARHYKKSFPDYRFRQDMEDGDLDKESTFYVLRKTHCPALLVENLFYDNRKDATFLLSNEGQNRIAKCLFDFISELYHG